MEPICAVRVLNGTSEEIRMRSGLLWLIGVPIPIIVILWLISGHL
jgi:hypothetical protein